MYDNPFLFSIMLMLYASIAMFVVVIFCKFFGRNESSEDEQLTPEKARQYLLDKYQDELKRKYSEKDFDYTAYILDFCLKLRNMDNETLKKVYGMVKEYYSE